MNTQLFLLKLAWKNTWRHKGRTIFISLTVALSVSMGIWVMAVFEGMNVQIEKAVKATHIGEFQWIEKKFLETTDTSATFELSPIITKAIGDRSFSPEMILDGHVSGPEGSLPLQLIGGQIEQLDKVIPIKEFIIEGNADGLLIGEQLALYYHLKVGDTIIFSYQDGQGELRSELLSISGIYRKNGFTFERRYAYYPHQLVQQLYFTSVEKPLFNRIVFSSLPPLLKAPTPLVVQTWQDLNPEMYTITQFHDGMVYFFLTVIICAILVTILTPINMVWFERLGETRMLKIIGVGQKRMWAIGLYEAFIMVFISTLISYIILGIIIGHQAKYGLDMRAFFDKRPVERGGIQLLGIIFPHAGLREVTVCFLYTASTIMISYSLAIRGVIAKVKKL